MGRKRSELQEGEFAQENWRESRGAERPAFHQPSPGLAEALRSENRLQEREPEFQGRPNPGIGRERDRNAREWRRWFDNRGYPLGCETSPSNGT